MPGAKELTSRQTGAEPSRGRPERQRKSASRSAKEPQVQGPHTENDRTFNVRKRKRVAPRPPRDIRRPQQKAQTPSHGKPGVPITAKASLLPRLSTAEADDSITALPLAKNLLDKIWVRHKNQHRTQRWWKSLSYLRKAVTHLTQMDTEEQSVKSHCQPPGTLINAQDVRRRFERESQLRTEKELWTAWVRETLVPDAYLNFSGLVADTQFANIGLVLIGVLADVVSVVGAPSTENEGSEDPSVTSSETADLRRGLGTSAGGKARNLVATSLRVTGLQSGELVERLYDSDDLGEAVERKQGERKVIPRRNSATDDVEMGESELEGNPSRQVQDKVIESTLDPPETYQSTPSSLHTPPMASKAIDSALPDEKSTVVATSKEKNVKTKASKVKSKSTSEKAKGEGKKAKGKKSKSKNAIDALFAGLT